MRTKTVILLLASAGLLLSVATSASAQTGATKGVTNVSASDLPSDDWRQRAMQARAEVADDAPRGRLHDPEGLADLSDREDTPAAADRGEDRGERKGGRE